MDIRRAGQIAGGAVRCVRRLHRDQRGDVLEYLLIMAAFAIPLFALAQVLLNIMKDQYGLIAFQVGWPFL
ncbi:MAG: hypothetical protein JXL80_14325 [Planctomycetes bacterium]|nr:hypothetical protein [Planctomycetota bacterium]